MEATLPFVDILLATYNGEDFLQDQLDSVFKQTHQHFRIIIRDDDSTDHTMGIVKSYQEQHSDKITIIEDVDKNLGATQNFARLLQHATADYIAFCDQDDIWLPEKLEVLLKVLQRLERENPGKPCLVYSDMKLIDEKGKQLEASVWKQLHLDPAYFTFNRLLIQNIPHGCAMVFNQAMKNLVAPIPKEAMLHDHWIAIIASALGVHYAIEKPLVLLRNHDKNVTRKQELLSDKWKRVTINFIWDEAYEHMVQLRVNQAQAIRERFASQLTPHQNRVLDQFILLATDKGFKRKWIYLKNGFFRTTWRHTLKMILRG
jgi:glycosyltransferase involved in cell wall biosynthesis